MDYMIALPQNKKGSWFKSQWRIILSTAQIRMDKNAPNCKVLLSTDGVNKHTYLHFWDNAPYFSMCNELCFPQLETPQVCSKHSANQKHNAFAA